MRFTQYLVLSLISAAVPAFGAALGASVNGTCAAGVCPPGVLGAGGSENDPINYLLTLANGDEFQVYGTFSGTNSGGGFFTAGHNFQVTYEGNANGTASGNDTIDVTLYYLEASGGASGTLFTRDVIGAFSPGIASSSSASSCVDGTLGCVGTLTPPGGFNVGTNSFSVPLSSGNFVYDPAFVSTFGAGSPVNSYIVWGQTAALTTPPVSPAPEPATMGLTGLALLVAARVGKKISRRV